MSDELQDEVISINSIYGDETLVAVPGEAAIYTLVLPAQPAISLRLEFPADYPDAPPSVLGTQSVGNDIAKGQGLHLVKLVQDLLGRVYNPGAPCMYDLIEEAGSRLQQLRDDEGPRSQDSPSTQTHGQPSFPELDEHASSDNPQPVDTLVDPPRWSASEVVTEKKSVFIARSSQVSSVVEAKQHLAHLLATDKKVAKATHNITAWRIRGENGVQYQDCDDDGETAAGSRLLHLMELMDVWGVMVVVTRWYGGVQLGPDRFRIINRVARDALVNAGFVHNADGEGTKKKGKG